MTPTPRMASEETLDRMSDIFFCPICGDLGIHMDEAYLYRTDKEDCEYRKRRELRATCLKCLEDGRGEVKIAVSQRF